MEKLTTQIGQTTVVTLPDEGRDQMEQAERHRRKVRALIQRQRVAGRRQSEKERERVHPTAA